MGASGGVPNIAVRLSAEGVADVVAAFARVRDEGKRTGQETSASLNMINGALSSLTALLPAVSLALMVTQMGALATNALGTADALGKLSQRTGANVGTLSVLNMLTHDAGLETESFSKGLTKLAKSQDDATNGSAKQKKAFADLGISMADLQDKDPADLLVEVSKKLEAMGGGAAKTRIEMTLFGKAGAELDPMLHMVATSFDQATDRAKKLGIYLDADGVASAMRAKLALKDVGDIAEGLGTQFDMGFAPQMAQAVETFSQALSGKGVNSVRTFGEIVGSIFKALVLDLLVVIDTAKFVFASIVDGVKNAAGSGKAFLQGLTSGGFAGAVAGVATYNAGDGAGYAARQDQRKQAYGDEIKDIRAKAQEEPTKQALPSKAKHPGGLGDGTDDEQKKQLEAARSAYLQSLADNELAILKAKNQGAEADDKRAYDAGLITLDEYYDARETRIMAEADAELKILETKREAALGVTSAAAADDKKALLQKLADTNAASVQQYKQLEEASKVQTAMDKAETDRTAALKAAEDGRAAEKHTLSIKELEDLEKLQKATGDNAGAEETQLQIDIRNYDELLNKVGKLTDAERAQVVAKYGTTGQAKIDFGRQQQAGSAELAGLDQDVKAVQDQASNGSISQIDAAAKILDLEQQRLVTLRGIGEQMTALAEASGDKTLIADAAKYNSSLDVMASKMKNVMTAQTYLVNQLSGAGVADVTGFFDDIISGSKSAGDAFKDLGSDFEKIISGMISKLLVYESIMALLGWIGQSDSVFGKAIVKAGPFGSAASGYTGNAATNAVAGVYHGQEWVFDAATTKAYRPLFEAISSGRAPSTPGVRSVSSVAAATSDAMAQSADSATVGFITGLVAPIINITNNTNQPVQQSQRTGSGGQSITDLVIGAITKDIVSGGQTAKLLQNQYGLSRQGTRKTA